MSTVQSLEAFGAEIQYFRTEPRYWEPLILRFKETGLRCVTSYVPWESHCVGLPDAKHPAGVFDFEGKTDPRLNLRAFLDLVEKHDLNLNFRAGPFCCNEMPHGGYPGWLVLGDPSMMVWDRQNRAAQGYWIACREGSQPSYLHPDYLALTAEWFRAADKILVPHLRGNGGCVTMINLDNEISYICKDGMLESDYNPVNVAPGGFYHQFLKEKYGAFKNVPYARKGMRAIEDIVPPRAVPEEIGADLAWYTDWIEFKTWCMCQYIRCLRAMHEENGVTGVTFMTNFNPHLPEGVPTRMPDFEEAVGGIVGYDFYRGTFMSYSGYHSMARVLKLMNASLGYTWSAEFMSGTWNKVLGTRVSDDHMRFMARCALAHGCKAIDWFMFHDRETWGDCPVSAHGHTRPSIGVLAEIPDLCFRKIAGWDTLVPLTDVAIVYDLVQHLHTAIGDPTPCNDNDMHVGAPQIAGVAAGKASVEYTGLFRLVEENGMQPGVVDILHDASPLDGYSLAFLAGSPVIERRAERALGKFVRGGGVLVVSGPLPGLDENGKPLSFLGLKRRPARSRAGIRVGKGRLIWFPDYLAQEKAEEESLASIAAVGALLKAHAGEAHVRIAPAQETVWIDWHPAGGTRPWRQPRNLASAVLQQNGENAVLFVLNHYPDAFRFTVTFGQGHTPAAIEDLDSGAVIPVRRGKAELDVDRKAAAIYRLR